MQVITERTTPPLPRSRSRDVFCVIEHAYRDLGIAGAACEGIFTNAGQTIAIGNPPDWLSKALPADEEWKIEWYKFYYGLDLAYAFSTTGDERYRSTWKLLTQSWIDQMPIGCDSSDVAARRIQNWIYAWNTFSRHAIFEPDFENEIISRLTKEIFHLRHHLTAERNHRTLELYALFIAALALPELDHGHLLDFAITELHRNLLTDIRPDGVHREQSTHYHMTALRSYLGARENARRFALQFPASYDERLEKACEFLLHVQRPDGFIPALSDADTGNYSNLLELAALIFNRSDFLYAATAGALGDKPAETFPSFPDGGYFIQRSGWGDDETNFRDQKYLIFDCGPIGDGGHGHYDLLNIEIAAHGKPLIVDPGRFTYAEENSQWRHWFKGTAAHNTVCVDELDQVPYRRGKPKGALAQGRLCERLTAPGFDMLCGEARSPRYDAIHTRRIFFINGELCLKSQKSFLDTVSTGSGSDLVSNQHAIFSKILDFDRSTRSLPLPVLTVSKPDVRLLRQSFNGEYWLIIDSLRGLVPHKFDLRFHLTADAWNHCTRIDGPTNTGIRTPDLVLLFEPQREPVLSKGWISKSYGIKEVAPIVSVVADGCENADFYTLIAPLELTSPLPQFQVHAEGHVRVQWKECQYELTAG